MKGKEETFRRTCHRPHLSSGELWSKCDPLEVTLVGQMHPWYLTSLRCESCSSLRWSSLALVEEVSANCPTAGDKPILEEGMVV